MSNRLLRTLFAAAVATAAFAVGAPAANAGLLVASAPNCTPEADDEGLRSVGATSTRTTSWRRAVPSRGREPWTLHRGASWLRENEPWKVNGSTDKRSLKLPPGASATSPVICVGLQQPMLRFFARNNRALLSTLTVEVIVQTSLGLKATLPIGVLLPSGKWKPSPTLPDHRVNLLPLLPGQKTPVQFRCARSGSAPGSSTTSTSTPATARQLAGRPRGRFRSPPARRGSRGRSLSARGRFGPHPGRGRCARRDPVRSG